MTENMSVGSKGGVIAALSMQDSFPVDHDHQRALERRPERSHREERKICLRGERVTYSTPPLVQKLVLIYGIMLAVRERLIEPRRRKHDTL